MQRRLIMKPLQQLEHCVRRVVPEYDAQKGLGLWTRAQTKTLQGLQKSWVGLGKTSAGDPRVRSWWNPIWACRWRKSVAQPSAQPEGLGRQWKQWGIQEKAGKASIAQAWGQSLSTYACCGNNTSQLHLVPESRSKNCSGFIPGEICMCQGMPVLTAVMMAL